VFRRTKIIATLGPASNSAKNLKAMINAGVDLFRINMSHANVEEHTQTITRIRQTATTLKRHVGILVDLQGPKIRIGSFINTKVTLQAGAPFKLQLVDNNTFGDLTGVFVEYAALSKDLIKGDILLLDDGRLELKVLEIYQNEIHTIVQVGGELSDKKGINKQGGGLSAATLTAKDKEHIKFAAAIDADYVAVSFPKSANDMLEAKQLLQMANSNAGVIAKIERAEAINCIEAIISASDAVMVARGDLGVEIGFVELPAIQKRIIRLARAQNKPVITATQMMESMIYNPIPTRAEVSDVANAVLDGTDAVMLSAETATGEYPIATVSSMHNICVAVESQKELTVSSVLKFDNFSHIDEAIAMAGMYIANRLQVKAIVALTESGATTLMMSRLSADIPIYGISNQDKVLAKMTLYKGVFPIKFDITKFARNELKDILINELKAILKLQLDDKVIVTRGDDFGLKGSSNTLKIVEIK